MVILLITHHLSDTISVLTLGQAAVTQTLQDLDGDGVSTTDEPVGVAFDGPTRAFVTLDHPNQVIGIEFDGSGNATLSEDRARRDQRSVGVNPKRGHVDRDLLRAVVRTWREEVFSTEGLGAG